MDLSELRGNIVGGLGLATDDLHDHGPKRHRSKAERDRELQKYKNVRKAGEESYKGEGGLLTLRAHKQQQKLRHSNLLAASVKGDGRALRSYLNRVEVHHPTQPFTYPSTIFPSTQGEKEDPEVIPRCVSGKGSGQEGG